MTTREVQFTAGKTTHQSPVGAPALQAPSGQLPAAQAQATQGPAAPVPALFMALELSSGFWKLGFARGLADSVRLRDVAAGDREAVLAEIARAKAKYGLGDDVPVVSCYEAGRDGFWIHRWLRSAGVINQVLDSSSIQVDRRQRRAKSDGLDAQSLVRLLMRRHGGETKACRYVQIPTVEEEDRRQLHRGRMALKKEQTALINRIKGMLASVGFRLPGQHRWAERFDRAEFVQHVGEARGWDGSPLPPGMKERLLLEAERLELIAQQIRRVETEQRRRIHADPGETMDQVRQLLRLKGIGAKSAWLIAMELGWRKNLGRKQVASLAGLTPTPYQSGGMRHEQGISKAGNRRLRQAMVELAWLWQRHQPGSALSVWWRRRFGEGPRQRKIGIVALARKLLIALHRWMTRGEVPEGAQLVEWTAKVRNPRQPRSSASPSTLENSKLENSTMEGASA